VPLAVSSAVFLSVSSPLITVGFSSSEQLLGHDFSFPCSSGEGGRGKSEKEQKEQDRTRNDQTGRKEGEDEDEKETDCHLHVVSMGEGFPLSSSSTCLSDLSGHKRLYRAVPKDSVKKGAHS
jgi:hypothetical protein